MDSPPSLGARLQAEGHRLRLAIEHLAGRALRRRVEPEDLVQEVYLRALQSDPARVPVEPASLRRWLVVLARHVVIDAVRAARAARRDGREEPLQRESWSRVPRGAEALPAAGPGPATRVAAAEGERKLLEAYRSLSPDHRRVLGLRQFEGLSAAETAGRMARSEAAVHSLYRRALEAWARAAESQGPDRGGRE